MEGAFSSSWKSLLELEGDEFLQKYRYFLLHEWERGGQEDPSLWEEVKRELDTSETTEAKRLFLLLDRVRLARGRWSLSATEVTQQVVREEEELFRSLGGEGEKLELGKLEKLEWHFWWRHLRERDIEGLSPVELARALFLCQSLRCRAGEEDVPEEWREELRRLQASLDEKWLSLSAAQGEVFLTEVHQLAFQNLGCKCVPCLRFWRELLERSGTHFPLEEYSPLIRRKHRALKRVYGHLHAERRWEQSPYFFWLSYILPIGLVGLCGIQLLANGFVSLLGQALLITADVVLSFSVMALLWLTSQKMGDRSLWKSRFWTLLLPALPWSGLVGVPGGGLALWQAPKWLVWFIPLGRALMLLWGTVDVQIERLREFFHWNVVLFSPSENSEKQLWTERWRQLQRETEAKLEQGWQSLEREKKQELFTWRLQCLREWEFLLERADGQLEAPVEEREISLEELVDRLLRVSPREVEQGVRRGTWGKSKALQLLEKWGNGRGMEKVASFLARLARGTGAFLEWILDFTYRLVDLHGLITPSQVLDRVGRALVHATKRPAWRLLLVGSVLLLLRAAVDWLGFGMLQPLTDGLGKYLGQPIVILGGICLVLFLLGAWMVHLAGEASEFYEKVAEAQFINLLEEIKYKRCQGDIQMLYERVLAGELVGRSVKPSFGQFVRSLEATCNLHTREETVRHVPWPEGHLVALLYRDYIDGAIFHHTDVKTAEQLLGNVTLENVRRKRLKYTRRDRARLMRLDLSRRASLWGPYFWFSSVVRSLSQQTAKLVLEYNRHCVPLSVQEFLSPEEKEHLEDWLHRRTLEKPSQSLEYRTSEFSALHFLSADPHRDDYVARRFGQKVLERLVEDRKRMIRSVFGAFPMHLVPKPYRTVNVYYLYVRYLWGGKGLAVPIHLAVLLGRGLGLVGKWLGQSLREVLSPDVAPALAEGEISKGDFGSALRLIYRMRKPIFMEIFRMRALLDPEYLGLSLPGYSIPIEGNIWEDLAFLQVPTAQVWHFSQVQREQRRRMEAFRLFLIEQKLETSLGLKQFLPEKDEAALGECYYPIVRALAMAFCVNYQGLAEWDMARREVEQFCQEVVQSRHSPGISPIRLFWSRMSGEFERTKRVLSQLPYWEGRSEGELDFCHLACLGSRRMRQCLHVLQKMSWQEWDSTWQEVVRDFWIWSQELLTLRTVHTLALLDILNYRDLVYRLGQYGDEPLGEGQKRASHTSCGDFDFS